jgi:putative hydrolase of the HAD superfamily
VVGDVTAVVFDVDGTLVDHDKAQHDGLREHLLAEGERLTSQRWQQWRALEEHHFARYLAGDLTFEEQRRSRVHDYTGHGLDDAEAEAWFRRYLAHFEKAWTLFPDALSTIDMMLRRGVTVAAFSNVSGDYTRHKLRTVGLLDRLAFAWGTDDVDAAKPDRLCGALSLGPREVLHVGDRYEADARGAARAGLRGVWLDRPGADPRGRRAQAEHDPAVLVVASLEELLGL